MRVCFVTGEYRPMQGGVGDYTHELGRALLRLGVEVVVLAPARALGADADDEPTVLPWIERWTWRSAGMVRRAIRDTKCDILHIQYQTGAFGMHPVINLLPWRLKLQRDRPRVITTFHDLRVPYLFPKAGRVRFLANRALIEGCDASILTNGEDFAVAARRHLERLGGPEPTNGLRHFHLVPIGSNIAVDPPPGYRREDWRARLGVKDDETLLCYFGLLNRSKGVDIAFHALRALLDQRLAVKLVIVGGEVGDSDPTNLDFRETLRELASRLALEGRLLWTGHVEAREVSGHLLAADIAVLPFRDGASFRRGSLMAVLAHGIPLVTTTTLAGPAVRWKDLIREPEMRDGAEALFVAPEDPAATAQAIVRLIEQPELRQVLGKNARRLSDSFTWPAIAERNLEIYQGLMG